MLDWLLSVVRCVNPPSPSPPPVDSPCFVSLSPAPAAGEGHLPRSSTLDARGHPHTLLQAQAWRCEGELVPLRVPMLMTAHSMQCLRSTCVSVAHSALVHAPRFHRSCCRRSTSAQSMICTLLSAITWQARLASNRVLLLLAVQSRARPGRKQGAGQSCACRDV